MTDDDGTTIRVLHVDDDPQFGTLVQDALGAAVDHLTVLTESDPEVALDRLASEDIDCVVADHDMPRMSGLELLAAVREDDESLPFILFTGKGSEEVASEAISAGVTDYLQKGAGTEQFALLANRITNAVGQTRDRAALERTERRLRELAEHTDDVRWMVGADWEDLLFINSAYEDLVGESIEALEADPRAMLAGVHPEDRDALASAMDRLSAGTPIDLEVRVDARSDFQRWAWVQGEPIRDESGSVARLVGFAREITARKRREQELEEIRERMEFALDVTDSIIYEIDHDEETETRHGPFERLYGVDRTAVPTPEAFYERCVHPEDRDAVRRQQHEQAVAPGGETISFEYRTNPESGTVRWLATEAYRRPAGDGELGDLIGLATDVTVDKERELELQRYASIVDASGDAVYAVDDDARFTFVNDAMVELTGYEASELLGADASIILDEAEYERARDRVTDLMGSEQSRTIYEIGVHTASGERIPCENHQGLLPADDEFAGSAGILRDVSERKAREAELEEANAVLRALLENLPMGILVEDADRDIRVANRALCDMLGIEAEPDDLVGTDCPTAAARVSDRFADPEGFRTGIEETIEAGESVSGERLAMADGRTLDRTYVPYTMPEGPANLWIYRDVSERERREESLGALQAATRELMGATDQQTVAERVVETARTVLNQPINTIWFYDDADDVLRPVASTESSADLLGDAPTYRNHDSLSWQAYESGEVLVFEDVREADVVHNPETPIRSEIIVPLGEYGVMNFGSQEVGSFDETDVSLARLLGDTAEAALDRAQREQELRLQRQELRRQNERLDEFASIVSHDLRNPLHVAEGHADLLAEDVDSDHLSAIRRALERMESLIENLLALSREGERTTEPVPIDLAEAARRSWESVETGDATLTVREDVRIRADPTALQQLLENLLHNAVEHGGSGVAVTVGALADGDGFYVADDGPGIPTDEREAVFESGYSTREEGTGLGLAIVSEIADAHGWSVTVTESPSGGAKIAVSDVAVV